MSSDINYLDVDDKNLYKDIISRKEFIQNYNDKPPSAISTTMIDKDIENENILILNNYQNFIKNFMSIDTKYDRLLLVHSTGVGKTITSLSCGIDYMQKIKSNIYILGFSKEIFRRELISRPEFGFVTKNEIQNLKEIKSKILQFNLKRDKDKYIETKKSLIRRLRKGKNGKIIFIGYKELFNRFITKINNKVDLDSITSLQILKDMIENKDIKINKEFIDSMNGSFIICDEIHNLYNSYGLNNWGLSLKVILDMINSKCLFLSATPINNKPYKITSVLTLLNKNKFYKIDDIFQNENLTKEGEKIIIEGLHAKISYLVDKNPELYPNKNFEGEHIPGISYLKFIKCPMSDLHMRSYLELINIQNKDSSFISKMSSSEDDDDKDIYSNIYNNLDPNYKIVLDNDSRYLNDFVMPGENKKHELIGLYTKKEINSQINNATTSWKKKYEIDLIKGDAIYNDTITGSILLKDNIKIYSTKYYKMLQLIEDCVKNNKGKIFIYHNYIRTSGAYFIDSVLRQNGMVNIDDPDIDSTKCSKCFIERKNHKPKDEHEYKPLKFMTITGMISKKKIDDKLDLFNTSSNKDGDIIKIIIGSRAIKESYDLKEIRNVMVLHQPENVSTLIQILGRAIRKKSHFSLEKHLRHVHIYILVSTIPNKYQKDKSYIYSFEEMKYKYKINMYKKIQQINDIIMNNAIDYTINHNINFTNNNSSFVSISENDSSKDNESDLFSERVYDKTKLIRVDYNKINTKTFTTYHSKDEIAHCIYIIKRLFLEYSQVWKYDDLLKMTKNPYFKTNINNMFISEDSFNIALQFLIYEYNNIEIKKSKDTKTQLIVTNYINDLINSQNNYITDKFGNKYKIFYRDEYYILSKYENENISNGDFNNIISELKNEKRNIYSINKYLELNKFDNYQHIKSFFCEKYNDYKIQNLFSTITEYDYDFHLHFIEEIIEYFINLSLRINTEYDQYHELYIKMLYFYNKFNIIIFANKLDKDSYSYYEKYIIQTNEKTYTSSDSDYLKVDDDFNYNNLISSVEEEYKNTSNDNLQFYIYHKVKKIINKQLQSIITKKSKKIYDYILPVGHIFTKNIKIYNPEYKKWIVKTNYNKIVSKFKDNKQIIGYLEKDKTGFDISFKIRLNNNTINKDIDGDKRKTIHGSICNHVEKESLNNILKILNIKYEGKQRKTNICNTIKLELIKLELQERKNPKSNIRYFYFYWE